MPEHAIIFLGSAISRVDKIGATSRRADPTETVIGSVERLESAAASVGDEWDYEHGKTDTGYAAGEA
jgi:hypothetical protein